jgi:hypothetical protein
MSSSIVSMRFLGSGLLSSIFRFPTPAKPRGRVAPLARKGVQTAGRPEVVMEFRKIRHAWIIRKFGPSSVLG